MPLRSTFSDSDVKKKVFFLTVYLMLAIISCVLFITINIIDITLEIWVSFGLLNISGIFFILAFVEYASMPPHYTATPIKTSQLQQEASMWKYNFILKNIPQHKFKKHLIGIQIKNRQQVKIVRKIYANYPSKHLV